ncbi:MAG TPA: S49 family peptidase, partial [Candidatus Nanoarchaeia archaeon]|nr:S49 family peptidase [Candidatus Nanoarchaeia archaeon]
PIVAVIRESGASGAFWIATSADYVFANRMSITGSIGVQASHLEFGGFLEEHNVTYRRLTAGKYKDIGTIWKEMTPEEEAVYQLVLDKLHEEFISAVAENRKLEVSYVRNLSTGLVFLGSEAKKLGLIDALGNKKDALSYLEQTLNITAEPVEYSKHEGFLQSLTGLTSSGFYQMGRGIGSSLEKEQQVTLTS